MKTILVATDFSAASNNAVLYAAQFAKAFNAKLVLYHAFRIIYTSDVLTPPFDLIQDCNEELEKQTRELGEKYQVDIEALVEDSVNIEDAIVRVAIQKEASIIFIGMKRRGRTMRKLFGSSAVKFSHNSSLPIIVVPEETPYTAPKTITLANDIGATTDMSILLPLKKVVQKFGAKLYVARIIKPDRDATVEKTATFRITFHLAELNPQMIFKWDENVNHGLDELLKENKADMIVMIPHHHSIIEKWLEGSKTNHMLFHAQIPVMILPDRNRFIAGKTETANTKFIAGKYAIE